MTTINLGIIGGGQLGSMLATAAKKLNIKTIVYCDDKNAPAQDFCDDFIFGNYQDLEKIKEFTDKTNLVTFEFENIPFETLKKINEIKNRKKAPIVVGGTGLYFKALIEGLVKIPNIPIKFRNKIRKDHKNIGQKNFHKKLVKLDPLVKNKIKLTDVQRTLRAYEIKLYTKKSIYEWFKNTRSKYKKEEFFKIYIDYPRKELLEKIYTRVIKMIKTGAEKEVKNFLKLKIGQNKTSNKVIGINEIRDFIEKKSSVSELTEKISIKTRQYAKRQATWARGQMFDWQKVNPKDLGKFLKKI